MCAGPIHEQADDRSVRKEQSTRERKSVEAR
jgi:hypothetical protein